MKRLWFVPLLVATAALATDQRPPVGKQRPSIERITLQRPSGPAGGGAAAATLLTDLEAHWKLDEITGSRSDSIATATLTDNNTVLASPRGPLGTVAKFTAADADYLSNASPIIDPTASFSVAGWIYRETLVDGGIINVDSGALRPFNIDVSANAYRAYPNGGYIASNSTNMAIGQWQFFTALVNREELALGRVHIYINGVDGTTRDMDVAIDSAVGVPFRIGRRPAFSDNSSPYRITRVGVWARALSAADMTSLMNAGHGKDYAILSAADKVGLTAYWNLAEQSGDRSDSHASFTLTDNNTVQSTYTPNPGAADGTATRGLAANSEYLSVALTIPNRADRTIAFWYWPTANGTYQPLFTSGSATPGSTNYQFSIGMDDLGAAKLPYFASPGETNEGATTFTYGAWNLVVYRYQDSGGPPIESGVYGDVTINNGAKDIAQIDREAVSANNTNVYIGAGNSSSVGGTGLQYANGLIDSVSYWSRVLSNDEITTIYNLGRGLFYPETAPGAAPTLNVTSPSTGPLSGLSVAVNVNSAASSPKAVALVQFYWLYCPAGACGAENQFGADAISPYTATWTFPTCGAAPEDRFRIVAYSIDSRGVRSPAPAGVDVRLTGRGC